MHVVDKNRSILIHCCDKMGSQCRIIRLFANNSSNRYILTVSQNRFAGFPWIDLDEIALRNVLRSIVFPQESQIDLAELPPIK